MSVAHNVSPARCPASRAPRRALRPLLALVLGACGAARPVPAAVGFTGVQTVVTDRLVFGRAIPGGGLVSEREWSAFVRDVITPHFPEGLTLWRAEGQWQGPRGDLVREPVMVVEVFHPPGSAADSVFASIATEYRLRFRQDAVLRVTDVVRTQLYDER